MAGMEWDGGYSFHGVEIRTSEREFEFSRRTEVASHEKLIASNLAAAWTPFFEESLIGGVLQGRKAFDPKGAGKSCKMSLWHTAVNVARLLGNEEDLLDALEGAEYADVKAGKMAKQRQAVKEAVRRNALKGWMRNEGGDSFGFENGSERTR